MFVKGGYEHLHMALLQTTLDTVEIGVIKVVAVIRRYNTFSGILFKGLVKAVVVRLVLLGRHSASVPKVGKVAVDWDCGSGRKGGARSRESALPHMTTLRSSKW